MIVLVIMCNDATVRARCEAVRKCKDALPYRPHWSLHIAAHMLAKDPEDSLNAMSYRILMITPSLYRVGGANSG